MLMSSHPARTYRRLAAEGVTAVGLVIQCYDQIVNSLYAAARALEAGDIERKTQDLDHALLIVSHLQNALDFDAGGEVARHLERFYTVMREEILRASAAGRAPAIVEVAGHFVSLREAWQEVERANRPEPTPNPEAAAPGSAPRPPSVRWSA